MLTTDIGQSNDFGEFRFDNQIKSRIGCTEIIFTAQNYHASAHKNIMPRWCYASPQISTHSRNLPVCKCTALAYLAANCRSQLIFSGYAPSAHKNIMPRILAACRQSFLRTPEIHLCETIRKFHIIR